MTALTLVSHHLCPYVQRAVIVLREKEVAYERVDIDLADKPAWFVALSPLGKVPLLRVGEDVLFESAVICEYLDEVTPRSLHPRDPVDRARHRAWIEFASATLDGIAGLYNAPDAAAFETRRTALADRFARLERHLESDAQRGDGPWFAGARFGMVDAAWGPVLRYFDVLDEIADHGVLDGRPHVAAWRTALAERPSVQGAVAPDYPARLRTFLARRGSHLSRMMALAA